MNANHEWSDRMCGIIQSIAARVARRIDTFERCRELYARGVELPPNLRISLDRGCVVIEWQGREVARDRVDGMPFFEDGPWVAVVEELSVAVALPVAA